MQDPRVLSMPGLQVNVFDMREVGDEIPLHTHPYDHGAAVIHGRVRILGREVEMSPDDAPIMLPANEEHGYLALEPNTIAIAMIDTRQPTFDPEA